jgi:hypothetical protein
MAFMVATWILRHKFHEFSLIKFVAIRVFFLLIESMFIGLIGVQKFIGRLVGQR